MTANGHARVSTELMALVDQVIQAKDGKMSLIGLFDQMIVSNLPFNWPRMFFVSVLKGQPSSTHNIRVTISEPGGQKEVFDQSGNIEMGNNGKTNFVLELAGLPLNKQGEYKITIYSQGEIINKEGFIFTVRKTEDSENAKQPQKNPLQN